MNQVDSRIDRTGAASEGCQERGVTAMMPLDTDPTTPGLRAGRARAQAEGMAVLIQVPRIDEPRGRVRAWRLEDAGRTARPAWIGASRATPAGSFRTAARPRKRLRRGVRRAGWSLLVLVAMAGTFTMGWTTRGIGSPRPPLLRTAILAHDAAEHAPPLRTSASLSDARPAVGEAEAESLATGPALDAPVADADVPVVFPGYLLPDNNREEPAHEGS